ncbi:hypothetical protein ACFL0T_06765 [Candidatus Omnitrophota bacterium]
MLEKEEQNMGHAEPIEDAESEEASIFEDLSQEPSEADPDVYFKKNYFDLGYTDSFLCVGVAVPISSVQHLMHEDTLDAIFTTDLIDAEHEWTIYQSVPLKQAIFFADARVKIGLLDAIMSELEQKGVSATDIEEKAQALFSKVVFISTMHDLSDAFNFLREANILTQFLNEDIAPPQQPDGAMPEPRPSSIKDHLDMIDSAA